jgi:hypothetical protein
MPAAKENINQFCQHGAPSTPRVRSWGSSECGQYIQYLRFTLQEKSFVSSRGERIRRPEASNSFCRE